MVSEDAHKHQKTAAVSLDRDIKVVIADCIEDGGKRQSRKVFFSTDTNMLAKDIFEIYRTRFQLEFVFRDAKQFTGLTHCQARNSKALSFAFNASLTSVNIARAFARLQGMDLSVGSTKTLLHNAAMVERFISMSGKHAEMRLITLISKNFCSTASEPQDDFYKINELLICMNLINAKIVNIVLQANFE